MHFPVYCMGWRLPLSLDSLRLFACLNPSIFHLLSCWSPGANIGIKWKDGETKSEHWNRVHIQSRHLNLIVWIMSGPRARRFAFLNFRSLGTLSFYDHRLSKFHTDRNHEFPSPKNIRSKNNHCEIVSSSESVCGKFFKMVFPKFATLSKIDLQPFHHLGVWLQLIYTYRWHGTSFRNFYKFNAKHSPPPAVLPIDAFFRDLNFLSVQVQTSFWIKMEIFQNAIKYSPQKRTSGTYKTGTPGRGR